MRSHLIGPMGRPNVVTGILLVTYYTFAGAHCWAAEPTLESFLQKTIESCGHLPKDERAYFLASCAAAYSTLEQDERAMQTAARGPGVQISSIYI